MTTNEHTRRQRGRVVIRDFLGVAPNVDPHDMPPGVAMTQINAMSQRPGELRVRLGFRVVQFDQQ